MCKLFGFVSVVFVILVWGIIFVDLSEVCENCEEFVLTIILKHMIQRAEEKKGSLDKCKDGDTKWHILVELGVEEPLGVDVTKHMEG